MSGRHVGADPRGQVPRLHAPGPSKKDGNGDKSLMGGILDKGRRREGGGSALREGASKLIPVAWLRFLMAAVHASVSSIKPKTVLLGMAGGKFFGGSQVIMINMR